MEEKKQKKTKKKNLGEVCRQSAFAKEGMVKTANGCSDLMAGISMLLAWMIAHSVDTFRKGASVVFGNSKKTNERKVL